MKINSQHFSVTSFFPGYYYTHVLIEVLHNHFSIRVLTCFAFMGMDIRKGFSVQKMAALDVVILEAKLAKLHSACFVLASHNRGFYCCQCNRIGEPPGDW